MNKDDKVADFSYYKPINDKQQQFHDSKAMHKLLIGGYRGGKTYPAMHEVFFICADQPPGSEFGVFRNTWDTLEDNVEKDMLKIAESANAIKQWKKTKHDLVLWNGVTIKFRPLSLDRKQLKGMNMCGFFIDDPDTFAYRDVISFLFTRLTNPPGVKASYFATIVCANYEGHDWLWKTYIKGREEGGDGTFAWWQLQTTDNNTLDERYIETLESVHSKSWMDRFVYGKLDSYTGLVYDEYDPQLHDADLSWCRRSAELIKITVTDVGITHPSVITSMATDYQNVYIYDEFYKSNLRVPDLAKETIDIRDNDNFRYHLIDPSSGKREQTSGSSVKDDLWSNHRLRYKNADNSKLRGIEIVKSLLTAKEDGKPRLYIDPVRCPNTVREIEMYKWKEPQMSDFDELAYKEDPVKKDDDCMDCLKYGSVFLSKYLRGGVIADNLIRREKEDIWEKRYKKLKIYQENPEMIQDSVDSRVNRLTCSRLARIKQLHENSVNNIKNH